MLRRMRLFVISILACGAAGSAIAAAPASDLTWQQVYRCSLFASSLAAFAKDHAQDPAAYDQEFDRLVASAKRLHHKQYLRLHPKAKGADWEDAFEADTSREEDMFLDEMDQAAAAMDFLRTGYNRCGPIRAIAAIDSRTGDQAPRPRSASMLETRTEQTVAVAAVAGDGERRCMPVLAPRQRRGNRASHSPGGRHAGSSSSGPQDLQGMDQPAHDAGHRPEVRSRPCDCVHHGAPSLATACPVQTPWHPRLRRRSAGVRSRICRDQVEMEASGDCAARLSRLRSAMASATCSMRVAAEPARSPMVRATRSTR